MTLACPKCGGTTFGQARLGELDEYWEAIFDVDGEVEYQAILDDGTEIHELSDFSCLSCDWLVVNGDGSPADEPDEIKSVLVQKPPKKG